MTKKFCDRCSFDITNKSRITIEFNESRSLTVSPQDVGSVILNKDLCVPCYLLLKQFFELPMENRQ